MSVLRRVVTGAIVSCLIPAGVLAQAPITIGTRVGEAQVSGYDAEGRRDPFASLIVERQASTTPAPVTRAPGLAGVAIADVQLKGIIAAGASGSGPQKFLALIAGPSGTTYLARPSDRLHDAVIRRIDRDGVVFLAQVPDDDGTTRGREVRKTLRPSTGDGR